MEKKIIGIHASIQYFRAIGAWGMAESLEKILKSFTDGSEYEKNNESVKTENKNVKACK